MHIKDTISQNPLRLVNVALPLPSFEPFTYSIPESLADKIIAGNRVIVPFGKTFKTGVVIGFPADTPLKTVKEIIDLADNDPPLPKNLLELCKWISDYYCCPLGETLATAHPAGMLMESKKVVNLSDDFSESLLGLDGYTETAAEIIARLQKRRSVPVAKLRSDLKQKGVMTTLTALEKRGIIKFSEELPGPKFKPQRVASLSVNTELNDDYLDTWLKENSRKSSKQTAVVSYLRGGDPRLKKEVMTETRTSSSVIKALVGKGILIETHKEVMRESAVDFKEDYKIVHTDYQKNAINRVNLALNEEKFIPFLLFGVTGSGKTEVYLEAISRCLQQGKTAMVLVPEIALTPQIASRFRRRFGAQVVILHSRISPGERYDSWRRLASGRARVVIGARSALFAPLKNLGLIVVDEEHEHSFKQINRPHYQARDCAVWLARHLDIPIVLGSATPSMETFYNAQAGKYELLELPERVAGGKFSTFNLVDLSAENACIGKSSISPLLMDKIEDRLEHGDRTIILQNRRGFSTFIKCSLCGKVEECPNCSVTLTYHITNRRLRCHMCGFQKMAPQVCGECGGSDLKYYGTGTQKVEDEIKGIFPDARVVRMDMDTTSRIDSHFKILEAFAKGEYDILLGTQMVAKGLDFPEVTLAAIICADTELLRPDFRAEEKTFRLLLQAAGRSGRHRPGDVVVQTFNPEHPVFNFVRHNDYLGFYEKTIRSRKSLRYPPFGRLIKINIFGGEEQTVIEAAIAFAEAIPRENVRILGPSPALISRIKRKYYYHIIIKTGNYSISKLAEIKSSLLDLRETIGRKHKSDGIAVEIDVDPVEMH